MLNVTFVIVPSTLKNYYQTCYYSKCVCVGGGVHVTCKLGGVAGLCPDSYCDYCDEIASQMSQIVCFKFMELSELSSMFQTSLQSHKHN